MKNMLKKSCLLWLSLLLVFSIVWFVGVASWLVVIDTQPSGLHQSSLYWLYLRDEDDTDENNDSWLNDGSYSISFSKKFLSVLNWLIIWKEHNPNSSKLVVIWWWKNNSLKDDHTWIGWWVGNSVNAEDWAIWWWNDNTVGWVGGVVVWWQKNTDNGDFWVVVWWHNGRSDDNFWVVLWWQSNVGKSDSLILWNTAKWGDGSFSWNYSAENFDNVAEINATRWVLIWTYSPIDRVALVVNWAVKLWNDNYPTQKWEINSKDWCIKVHDDGDNINHVLGKTSESDTQCWAGKWCQFWKTLLQHGDVVSSTNPTIKAYSAPYATNCNSKRITITCYNWNLGPNVYPYCYDISNVPTL